MAKNNESLNNSLFQLLRSRGYNPTLLGTDGKEIPVPDEAEVFQFHFIKDDKDYGPVTISIDGLNKLVIYYNDAIASSPSEEGHSEDTSWFTLLNHLKRFSQGHQLSFELKNTDHLKYDMAKRNNMKKIDEAAKWRQGYSASGHPAGHKHKSGEVGPIGGTFTNEPSGYDGDTKKVPVQKYRDKEDELSGRANTKLSTTGKPLLPRNAQKNLKGAINQSKGKHGPVGVLPEGLGDDFSDMAKGMKNKDGSPRFANVRQGKPPVKPAGQVTNPRPPGKEATSPADWYAQASGGRRYTGDSKLNKGKSVVEQGLNLAIKRGIKSIKRAAQGWDSGPDLLGTLDGDHSNSPRNVVNRNKGYDDETIKQLRRKPSSAFAHSPAGLQARVLDREAKKRGIEEGYYPTGRKSSYSDNIPEVKIILQHSRALEEGERRYRAIERIFVENAAGERFLLDTTKPGLARVYARHIAEGGTPYDEQGKHIHSLCEEYTKMAGFVRATRNGQFNESTQSLVNEGVNHYNNLRETLHKMAGRRGYNAYFESWTPTLTEDEDSTDLSEMFASTELDPRIESVMPILRKLNKNITEVDHSAELSEWADEVIDEALGMAGVDSAVDRLSGKKKVDEVSNELLGRYKKAAGDQSSAFDRNADYHLSKGSPEQAAPWTQKANKRFSGIVKATNKEFANDNKPKQVEESPKTDFRKTVEQQQYATIEKIKNSDFSAPAKEYLIAINDPTGAPFRLSYRSFPRGQEAREKVRQEIAQKYNIDPELLNQADQEHLAGYGRQAADILNRINGPTPVDEADGLESNNPEGIPEATNPRQAERDRRNAIMTKAAMPNEPKQTQAHFPDTKQGAVASLSKNANPRFVKQMDLPNCVVHADPQVEGVWAIDNFKTGVRVIVYLAGYQEPGGDIRGPYDDFEEGQIPKREMMRHQRNDQAQNDVEDEMMENRDELDNQSRGLLAPGGILKKLKKDLRYALDSGLSSEQEVARLRAKIAELEGKKKDTEVKEDLGPEQKKVGQAGPTDPAPLRGKLVGACESVDHLAHIVKLSKG
jgi:hypothetical protein